jgi:hypothetical protein
MSVRASADQIADARRMMVNACDSAFAAWTDVVGRNVRRDLVDRFSRELTAFERALRETDQALRAIDRQLGA